MYDYIAEWRTSAVARLGRVRAILAAHDADRARAEAGLRAAVEDLERCVSDDIGATGLAIGTRMAIVEDAALSAFSLDWLRRSNELAEIEADFSKQGGTTSSLALDGAATGRLDGLLSQITALCSDHAPGERGRNEPPSYFLSLIEAVSTPEPTSWKVLFVPQHKRGTRVKTILWTVGILLLLSFAGSVFWPFLVAAVAFFVGSAAFTQQHDEKAASLKQQVAQLHDQASALTASAERAIAEAGENLALSTQAKLQTCHRLLESASITLPRPGTIEIGRLGLTPLMQAVSQTDFKPNFKGFMLANCVDAGIAKDYIERCQPTAVRILSHDQAYYPYSDFESTGTAVRVWQHILDRRCVLADMVQKSGAIFTPTDYVLTPPNWKIDAGFYADSLAADPLLLDGEVSIALGEVDELIIQVGLGADPISVARRLATEVMGASLPGRARFMFVEPGRLAEAYRPFSALNESPAARIGERLFVTHVSELAEAVDALRVFVGRIKEAMTRHEEGDRRITKHLGQSDEAGFLQRAVVFIDQTNSDAWPAKDQRRIREYLDELAGLARVGAAEGSVLLVDLCKGLSAADANRERALSIRALSKAWLLDSGVRTAPKPAEGGTVLAARCEAWLKEAKAANSALAQKGAVLDWSDKEASDTRHGLDIEIGRHGASRSARLVLGKDGGHHAICIGRTGSGKTNLFHVIISNLVRKYSPEELELYLLDFKEGVEFAAYADVALPHCRAVAIDADRGFGMSVLAHLRRELNRRANVFKAAGVGITNLEKYEVVTGQNMPRIVLLIDEFQVLLQGDKTLGAATGAAAAALEDLVRRGRSFGLHVILGSQTLAGRELTSAALGQFAVRIVLPSSPADAAMLLGEQPVSGQLRSPGDAIVWNAGQGEVSDFHLAKIFAAELDDLPDLADKSRQHSASEGSSVPTPYVFRGSGPNELSEMLPHLERMQSERKGPDAALFAIGASTIFGETPAAILGRSRARNVLFVHRNEEMRQFFTYSAAESFLRLNPNGRLVLCDLDEARDFDGRLLSERMASQFPERISVQTLEELATSLAALDISDEASTTELYVVAGAHLTNLTKEPGFAQLLKDGPEQGRHLLTTCDTVKNLERVVERTQISEFGIRALGPASASDSQRLLEVNDAESLTLDHQYVVLDDAAKTRLSRLQILAPQCLRVEHGERAGELADA